jgi:hypothetical protein
MPIPKRKPDEDKADFLSRCMSNPTMNKEYTDDSQRYAVCNQSAKGTLQQEIQDVYYMQNFGSTDELTEDNFVVPNEEDYVSTDEVFFEESEVEEFDISVAKPGLWENIRKKKEREGKKYKPAKPGDPDRPSKDAWKKAQSSDDEYNMQAAQIKKMATQLSMLVKVMENIPIEFEEWTKDKISKAEHYIEAIYDAIFYAPKESEIEKEDEEENDMSMSQYKYKDPRTNEVYLYDRMGTYRKNGQVLTYIGKAAEYQGRKVQLGKPFRTPKGPKKFSVYVKNDKGNVVKVNFGDPNMKIKKNIPERRKSFRARHNCDNPGPRWKARYWSCRAW